MQGNRVVIYREGAWGASALFQWFREEGYAVSYASEESAAEGADLLILCPDLRELDALSDGEIGKGHDFARISSLIAERLDRMKRCVDGAVPRMRDGGKRIAFLTGTESSVSLCRDRDRFGAHMLLAAVNMLAKMTFNRLRPLGFTVRCFALSPGIAPGRYMLQDFCYDAAEPPVHSEENRLTMRDGSMLALPW